MKRGKHQSESAPRHIGAMDIILIIVGILLTAFTGVMVLLFMQQGAIPDTLCTCVFACLGGECGIMGWIKTTKERNREREWQQEDRKQEQEAERRAMAGADTFDSTISRR